MAGAPYDQGTTYDPVVPFNFEQVTVTGTAVGFTAATCAGAKRAVVIVETAPVRYRADATDGKTLNAAPTASVGMLANVGEQLVFWGPEIQLVQFIRTGATSATLDVEYSR